MDCKVNMDLTALRSPFFEAQKSHGQFTVHPSVIDLLKELELGSLITKWSGGLAHQTSIQNTSASALSAASLSAMGCFEA